jgi:hypothetical protein
MVEKALSPYRLGLEQTREAADPQPNGVKPVERVQDRKQSGFVETPTHPATKCPIRNEIGHCCFGEILHWRITDMKIGRKGL